MTKREKILAVGVGVLALAIVAWFALGRITNAFTSRSARIADLEDEIYEKEAIIRRGHKAARDLQAYQERSLPANLPLARSLYQNWLLEVAEKDINFTGVNVGPQPGRPMGDVYYQHKFLLTCQGDLEQLTDFLYDFYNVGYLHRVSRLSVKPIPRSRNLNLSFTIEALSLNRAESPDRLTLPPSDRLAHAQREEYLDVITMRNLFAPANNPPQLAVAPAQQGNPASGVSFQVRASDPDDGDRLSFSIEDAPDGAKIDPATGMFSWMPTEKGEYLVAIAVSDNGLPARTDRAEIRIAVVDPPPPPAPPAPEPPGFDPATQAVVTGIIDALGRRELFVTVRTEGRVLKLTEGDPLSVGTIKGVVHRIGRDEVEIVTEDGRNLVVELGKSLVAT